MQISKSVKDDSKVNNHYPELDGLRGIAILSVMTFHFLYFGHIAGSNFIIKNILIILNVGWCGVDLFFVLSGFLITGILYDSRQQAHFFHKFYWRRILRIFPLYYLFLILTFFCFPVFDTTNTFKQLNSSDQLWFWSYISNFRIAFQGWNSMPTALHHFWSLAIEEQFYLLWPLLVYVISRRFLLSICVCLFFLALFLRIFLCYKGYWYSAYTLMPARLDPLVTGAFIALLFRESTARQNIDKWIKPSFVITSTLLVTLFVLRNGLRIHDPLVTAVCPSLFAIFFGTILIMAISTPRKYILRKILTRPILTFFGKYSYALYVFHQPIAIYLYALCLNHKTTNRFFALSFISNSIIYFLVAFLTSIIIAIISWHFFEKHFLKLKDHYIFLPKVNKK